jgi:hypothetical protein
VTITDIIIKVSPYKPISKDTLYKVLRAKRIKPLGKVRQCPQQYPDDTPKRVLKHFGIKLKKNGYRPSNLLAA